MNANQTISFPRELSDELGELIAEKARVCGGGAFDIWEAICEQFGTPDIRPRGNPEGKREYFEKWVMATKHPVFGFLDGRSLARSDDRTGYADEYVQGLWVAYLAFGVEHPAPVAVPRLEMAHVVRAHMEIPGCPVLTSNQCHALAMNLNESLSPSL